MISVKSLLKDIERKRTERKNNNNLDNSKENKDFNLEEFINGMTSFSSTKYIVCDENIIEVSTFYYESVHEFFNDAISIKLNNEILYSGYKEPGVAGEFYIKGKYQSKQLAINDIKNIIKDKEFKIKSSYEYEREYDR